MRWRRFLATFVVLFVLLFVMVAGGLQLVDRVFGPKPEPGYTPGNRAIQGLTTENSLLAWVADGVAPGEHDMANAGELRLIDGRGGYRTVLELPSGTWRVHACGNHAASPDGRYFAFYIGGVESGALYLMDGINPPVEVAEMHAMACKGVDGFQFAPSGSRFAYINFYDDAATSDFPSGVLHVVEAATRTETDSFENVASFDINDQMVAHVGFFPNDQGEAKEAAVFRWTDGTPEEISTLFAEEDCQFNGADLALTSADRMVVVMGRLCERSGSSWVLYNVDAAAGRTDVAARGDADGSYYANSWTNTIYASPDESAAYFTVPNGLARNVVNLRAVSLNDFENNEVLVNNAVMPRFIAMQLYNPRDQADPLLSPDGRWLAVVSQDPDGTVTLHVLDLNAPDLPPISISAWNPRDTVSSLAFTPDSGALLFVGGGNDGANNSLFALDLSTEAESRLVRARFAPRMVVNPAGSFAALAAWETQADTRRPSHLTLVVVDLENNQSSTLLVPSQLAEGNVSQQRFVYPLSWRQ